MNDQTNTTFPECYGVDPARLEHAVRVRPGTAGVREGLDGLFSIAVESTSANELPNDARICGVDGSRCSWTRGQRAAEVHRTGCEALALLDRARDDGLVVDPVTALAAAAASQVCARAAMVVVVDDGVGVYRFRAGRLEPIVRLGGGRAPIVSGTSVDQPPHRYAGPAALLEVVASTGGDIFADVEPNVAGLSDLPVDTSPLAFATGYAAWRSRIFSEPELFGGAPELAALALGVALRDILRFGATAAALDNDAALCFVGRVWRHDALRRSTTDRFPTSCIVTPSDEAWAIGAAVCGLLSGRLPGEAGDQAVSVRSATVDVAAAPVADESIPTYDAPAKDVATFADLFAPVTLERFFEEFADQRSLYVRGTPGRFEGIFDGDRWLAAVRETHRDHPYADPIAVGIPRIQRFHRGYYFPVASPASPYPPHWERVSSWAEAHAHWASVGWPSTLRLSGAQFKDRELNAFLWQMQALFRTHCTINAYYSPGGGDHGLTFHSDKTHIFVLQVEGSKHWRLDRGPIRCAQEREEALRELENGCMSAGVDVWLTKGDLLYIPAETWHRAIALDGPSVHLTFGARRQTGLTFLRWLGGVLAGNPAFHEMTTQLEGEGEPSLSISHARLERLIGRIREQIAADGLIERFVAHNAAEAWRKTEIGALR